MPPNETPHSTLKRIKNRIENSITVKFFLVGFLSLILLIPTFMIEDLIEDREERRDQVTQEIGSKWGQEQTLKGPVLNVPYKHFYRRKSGGMDHEIRYAHFLPDSLHIKGNMKPRIRYRGIYQVILYQSDLKLSGRFSDPDFQEWKIPNKNILWDKAFVSMGITDMRGIKEAIDLRFSGKNYSVDPGIPSNDILHSGISTKVDLGPDSTTTDHPFEFSLKLNGSETLKFTPVGKKTKVKLRSEWSTPSFGGAFLPNDRKIDKNGFRADWKVLHLNRNYPQQWKGEDHQLRGSAFGVELLFPVDHYQKSLRAVKYAIMFIGLTFLTFFFSEVLNRKRIHPIQYLLIGLALCIFYTLLISLSEHFGFTPSYLIASAAIIILITSYSGSILRSKKLTALVGFLLLALYTFLFTTLQLQAYSLLLGSIGLFVVMALVMYLSRNVDWYRPIDGKK
ncbi:MAG: cell envelope integrity protein CreD [Flavobacteriales bacterium]